MSGNWVRTTRLAVFSVVSLFSFIVLAVAGNWISLTQTHLDNYAAYAALAVATAVLTFSIPAMLIIDLLRRGAFSSMIVVELGWLGFLWIMWLATGAYAADQFSGVTDCSIRGLPDWLSTGCHETQAIIAFSFLNWIALTGYIAVLLTLAIIAANRGAPIWMSSVKEAEFGAAPKLNMSGAMGTPEGKPVDGAMQGNMYPPQQV